MITMIRMIDNEFQQVELSAIKLMVFQKTEISDIKFIRPFNEMKGAYQVPYNQ